MRAPSALVNNSAGVVVIMCFKARNAAEVSDLLDAFLVVLFDKSSTFAVCLARAYKIVNSAREAMSLEVNCEDSRKSCQELSSLF